MKDFGAAMEVGIRHGGALMLLLLCSLTMAAQSETDKAWGGVKSDEAPSVTQRLEVMLDNRVFRSLKLKNINGTTRIVGGVVPTVKIEAVKKVKAGRKLAFWRGAKSLKKEMEGWLKTIRVDINHDGQILRIQTLAPTPPSGFNMSVDYVIHVPSGMRIEAETANGSVQLGDVGPAKVQVTNGNIECQFLSGLEAGVTNGRVTCADVSNHVSIRVVNGQVELTQSQPPKGKIDIQAGNGQIKLALPEKSAFNLEATVNTGAINSDFPVTVSSRVAAQHARGAVGRGGPEIRLKVQTGSIGLHKLTPPATAPIASTGQRYDLFCGGNTNVTFDWGDIPALLEMAQDRTVLENRPGKFTCIPGTHAGSYIQVQCVQGMVALYLIEGICQYEIARSVPRSYTVSFSQCIADTPFCTRVEPKPWWSRQEPRREEASPQYHRTALAAYRKWWDDTRALPPLVAARRDPLAGTGLRWFANRGWRQASANACQRVRKAAPTPPRLVRL